MGQCQGRLPRRPAFLQPSFLLLGPLLCQTAVFDHECHHTGPQDARRGLPVLHTREVHFCRIRRSNTGRTLQGLPRRKVDRQERQRPLPHRLPARPMPVCSGPVRRTIHQRRVPGLRSVPARQVGWPRGHLPHWPARPTRPSAEAPRAVPISQLSKGQVPGRPPQYHHGPQHNRFGLPAVRCREVHGRPAAIELQGLSTGQVDRRQW